MSTLMAVGIGGSLLASVNAAFWLAQHMSERRWKYTGSITKAWCLKRFVLNAGLAVVFAAAGFAGWIMAV